MEIDQALQHYENVISKEFIEELLASRSVATRDGIFSAAVVVWLMIYQRLHPDHSLASAIEELRVGPSSSLLDRSSGSIKARCQKISTSTGGYANARQRIDLSIVENIADRLNASMFSSEEKIFILDGSSLTISYSPENIEEYPQYTNHYGKAHFPIVRVGVAVEAGTGVALRPAFGPFNGPEAVSELSFVEPLLDQLPCAATAIADRYYGCFFFVAQAKKRNVQIVVRLKDSMFRRLTGSLPTGDAGEITVRWQPSKYEQERHPSLREEAVDGRCIWYRLCRRGFKPTMLCLFTTSQLPIDKIVELYGLRWKIEDDIRSLKSTLNMQFITAKLPDLVRKEIILGAVAYNLVRRFLVGAARQLRVPVRQLSFMAALRRIRTLGTMLLSEKEISEPRISYSIRNSLLDLNGLLLPQRNKKRKSTPRTKWRRGNPRFKTNADEPS